MSIFKNTLLILTLAASTAIPYAAVAECSSNHAKADQADSKTMAIYPLAKEAGFTTLTAAIKAAGLDETLTEKGPFTVFAPTDEAFAKLPEGTVESLLANPEALKKVLLYHVVSGSVTAKDVAGLDSAQTLNGTTLAIATKDGVMINDSNVIQADIAASNGVVHVIDTVLIPENL